MQQRTVQVKLDITSEQLDLLKETQRQYKTAFDTFSAWFVANKDVSKTKNTAPVYEKLRKQIPNLPSALIQTARDTASEAVKSYNSNHPKRKWSKIPRMSSAMTMRYDIRLMTLTDEVFTFSTVGKRQKTVFVIPAWFTKRYTGWSTKSGTIGIDKRGLPFVNLTYRGPITPELRTKGKAVGLDRGIHTLVYTSEGGEHSGKKVRKNNRRHLYNRSTAQRKGTRSAKRRLKAMSGKEMRFTRDVNHVISKKLASDSSVSTYVLEDLTGISRQAKAWWKKHSNKRMSDWPHYQLLAFLTYKCQANGIAIAFVDPAYTSQTCSQCKTVDKTARAKSQYRCKSCSLVINADYNAAINIRDRHLSAP